MNQTGTQTLETARLILRKFRIEDAQDMYDNWASDPEVTKYLTWPTHTGPDVTERVLMDWIPHYEEPGYYNWAIIWKKTGMVIGNISVVGQSSDGTDAADIGYCLSRSFWGQDIMPEALKAVISFLFDSEGYQRIAASHDIANPRSGRVMEKAGMKEEGILRGAGKNNTGICDLVLHSILRDEGKRAADSDIAPDMVHDIFFIKGSHKFNYRVCAIILKDNKILAMHDERSPYYYLPGGRVCMGETAEHAVIRELEEELDIKGRIIRPLWLNQGFFTEDVDHLNYHELCLYFLIDISDTDLLERGDRFILSENEHVLTFEWLDFDRLKDEYFYPIFLKKEIFHLPDELTIREEYE